MDIIALIRDMIERKVIPTFSAIDTAAKTNSKDLRNVWYSCLLYEQISKSCPADAIFLFWESELTPPPPEISNYSKLIKKASRIKIQNWPREVGLECTTFCTAKCKNCTHEELITNGLRVGMNAHIHEIYYRIRKSYLLSRLFSNPNEKTIFAPVGLGEPFCYPQMIDVIKYAGFFFPVIEVTTNLSLLDRNLIDSLLKTKIDTVQASMSYFNKRIYENQIGMPFERSRDNLKVLFESRNKHHAKTKIRAHIFDNELKTFEDEEKFVDFYKPYLQKGDSLTIRPYLEVTKGIKGFQDKHGIDNLSPCYELWHVLATSVEGNIFPCCLGVWKEYDSDLSLGKIDDSPIDIAKNLLRLRKEHQKGQFKNCLKCEVLHTHNAYDYRIDQMYYPELLKFCKGTEKIFLYGAGWCGKKIQEFLANNGVDIAGFIISTVPNEQFVNGIKVFQFDKLMQNQYGDGIYSNGDKIVVSVVPHFQKEIIRKILEKGIDVASYFVQRYFPRERYYTIETLNTKMDGVYKRNGT